MKDFWSELGNAVFTYFPIFLFSLLMLAFALIWPSCAYGKTPPRERYREHLPYVPLLNPPDFILKQVTYKAQCISVQHDSEQNAVEACTLPQKELAKGVELKGCENVDGGAVVCFYEVHLFLPGIGKWGGLIEMVRPDCRASFYPQEMRVWPITKPPRKLGSPPTKEEQDKALENGERVL